MSLKSQDGGVSFVNSCEDAVSEILYGYNFY